MFQLLPASVLTKCFQTVQNPPTLLICISNPLSINISPPPKTPHSSVSVRHKSEWKVSLHTRIAQIISWNGGLGLIADSECEGGSDSWLYSLKTSDYPAPSGHMFHNWSAWSRNTPLTFTQSHTSDRNPDEGVKLHWDLTTCKKVKSSNGGNIILSTWFQLLQCNSPHSCWAPVCHYLGVNTGKNTRSSTDSEYPILNQYLF